MAQPGDVDSVNTQSYGRQIGLNTKTASPPVPSYITVDDVLIVSCYTRFGPGLVLNVYARILLPDGKIQQNTWILTTIGPGTSIIENLPEGFLLSLVVTTSTLQSTFGQAYILAQLSRAPGSIANGTGVLIAGYLSLYAELSWPPGVYWPSTFGAGWTHQAQLGAPGAGTEWSTSVPANTIWRLKSIYCTLTTSAAVANRVPHFILDDGANILADLAAPAVQAAGVAVNYSVNAGGQNAAAFDGLIKITLPLDYDLLAGFRIRSLTTALQAGDTYSAVNFLIEEWLNL
jgi:hypothetical protein